MGQELKQKGTENTSLADPCAPSGQVLGDIGGQSPHRETVVPVLENRCNQAKHYGWLGNVLTHSVPVNGDSASICYKHAIHKRKEEEACC